MLKVQLNYYTNILTWRKQKNWIWNQNREKLPSGESFGDKEELLWTNEIKENAKTNEKSFGLFMLFISGLFSGDVQIKFMMIKYFKF